MAKILLVEDDKSLREIYGVRLMAEGYEIVSAGDGEEALALAVKERPDLIVSDVMMPKISGFDMLDILRSTSETKNVKVIMMTALSSDDQRARGEALGADRYLVKSQVGIEDVVRTVHDVLGDSIAPAAPAMPSFGPSSMPVAAPIAAPIPAPVAAPAPATVAPEAPVPVFADVTPAPAAPPAYVAPEPVPVQEPTPAPAFDPTPVAVTPVAPEPLASDPSSAYAAPEVAPAPQAASPFFEAPVATAVPQLVPQPAAEAPMPIAAPEPAPAPVAPAFASTPVAPVSTTLSELPVAPVAASLPQPTAPFSSPAPASLGERVIEPLTAPAAAPAQANDIASQIEQELGTQGTPPPPPTV